MTPTTYGRDFAYCLKSHGGVRGFNASLWRFLLRCTLFCHSVATFLTSVSSYEGGCGFEDPKKSIRLFRSIKIVSPFFTLHLEDVLPESKEIYPFSNSSFKRVLERGRHLFINEDNLRLKSKSHLTWILMISLLIFRMSSKETVFITSYSTLS